MENRCVCCGRIIPEGRQVCKICELYGREPAAVKEQNFLIARLQEENRKLREQLSQKWRSPKEPPEENDVYLVTYKGWTNTHDGTTSGEEKIKVGEAYYIERGHWDMVKGCRWKVLRKELTNYEILAWRPLPEPYRED